MDDPAQVIPQPVKVQTAAGEFEVWPLRARQLAPFARAVGPLVDEFNAVSSRVDSLSNAEWLDVIERRADELIDAVAIALEDQPAEIGALMVDDLLALVATVVQVNSRFFAQRIVPKVMGVVTGIMAGLMPSTDSSALATATPPITP